MQRERVSIPKMLAYLLFLLVFYALQSSVFSTFNFQGFHFDLLPCFVAAVSLFDGPVEGAIMGLAVGIFYDLGFIGIDGLYPIYYLLYGIAAGELSRLILPENYISMLLLTTSETLLMGALRCFFYLVPRKGATMLLVMQQVAGNMLLTAMFCFVVYIPMRRIHRRFSSLD